MSTQPINKAAISHRRFQCANCPTPCALYQSNQLDHTKPDVACPLPEPRWREWATVRQDAPVIIEGGRVVSRRRVGLGDVVSAVAQPIAKAIDKVAGTKLAKCGGCTGPGGRKDRLNAAVPDVLRPLRRR